MIPLIEKQTFKQWRKQFVFVWTNTLLSRPSGFTSTFGLRGISVTLYYLDLPGWTVVYLWFCRTYLLYFLFCVYFLVYISFLTLWLSLSLFGHLMYRILVTATSYPLISVFITPHSLFFYVFIPSLDGENLSWEWYIPAKILHLVKNGYFFTTSTSQKRPFIPPYDTSLPTLLRV